MFEHQQLVIKSGSGENYFEATATLDTMASTEQTKLIMDSLKAMQKDRMDWAASRAKAKP